MSRYISRDEWNNFLINRPHAEFLQSWEWGENAYLRERAEILRIAYPGTGEIRAVCQLIERGEGTPFRYWCAPGGPIAESAGSAADVMSAIMAELRPRFAPFFRIEPAYALLDTRTFVPVFADRPKTTRILDLSKGLEAIFSAMHEKTRYNIRLASRKGVVVREMFAVGEDHPDRGLFDASLKRFHELLRETARRGDFSLHPWIHYAHLIDAFCRNSDEQLLAPISPTIRLYTAWYDDTMVATILAMAFGDTVSYLHGASSNAHRSVMAPHALQWHAIREAQEQGYRYYDLWGVAPANAAADNSWVGFTRFKEGFGGDVAEYPGTFDIPLHPLQYWLYSISRKVNRALRRPIR